MNDSPSPLCPACSQPLPPDSPAGLCARCLMAQAMVPTAEGLDEPRARSAPPAVEELTALFPQLEIEALIGEGGMSAVYRAVQPRLGRKVALKILPASLSRDPAFASRFAREGQLLARLNHPGIVAVHDFGQAGGYFYLIMEYVDGVNLRQALRSAPFTAVQALGVVPRICEALQYAHEEGVLHRDIKPENILLDHKGRVKLADFGIAKLISEPDLSAAPVEAGTPSLTQAGAALGTPDYMAPEQRHSPAGVDPRADIYSLGVVFYELLTGERPGASFVPPSSRMAVDLRVDDIVRQALETDRSRRQASAEELKTQVLAVTGAPPVLKTPPSPGPWLRSHFEYQSPTVLFGWPLLHISTGRDPATGTIKTARGIFAIGQRAHGWIAFGGRARGFIACGALATGAVAIGGVAVGIVSLGGLALGLLVGVGGLAGGLNAIGGAALGWHAAGGLAMGWHAFGGRAIGHIASGGLVTADHVIRDPALLPPGMIGLHQMMPWMGLLAVAWVIPVTCNALIFRWAARQAVEGGMKAGVPLNVSRGVRRAGKFVYTLGGLALGAVLAMAWLIHQDPSWHPAPAEAFTAFALPVITVILLAAGVGFMRIGRKGRAAEPLPRGLVKGLKSFGWAMVLVLVIRDAFFQAYRIQTQNYGPELRQGSLVAVWKPVREFSPGDFVTYPDRQIFRVGRIVEVRPETLLIHRQGHPPAEVPRPQVIGKVVLNTRPSETPP
ncbi:MAG: serine/threonine-protein kinase [Verrucomicrobiota bacterium]